MFKIIGYDNYDYSNYFIGEYDDIDEALKKLEKLCATPNGNPTSFSDIYFIYNDKEELLYKANYDEGITKIT